MVYLALDSLPDPGERYKIGDVLGVGIWAKVISCSINARHWLIETLFNRFTKLLIQKTMIERLRLKFNLIIMNRSIT